MPALARKAITNIESGNGVRDEENDESVASLAKRALKRIEHEDRDDELATDAIKERPGADGDSVSSLAKRALHNIYGEDNQHATAAVADSLQDDGESVASLAKRALNRIEGEPAA